MPFVGEQKSAPFLPLPAAETCWAGVSGYLVLQAVLHSSSHWSLDGQAGVPGLLMDDWHRGGPQRSGEMPCLDPTAALSLLGFPSEKPCSPGPGTSHKNLSERKKRDLVPIATELKLSTKPLPLLLSIQIPDSYITEELQSTRQKSFSCVLHLPLNCPKKTLTIFPLSPPPFPTWRNLSSENTTVSNCALCLTIPPADPSCSFMFNLLLQRGGVAS